MRVPHYPLLFDVYLRPMPWGGSRLQRWVDAPFADESPIGEAWLLSEHSLHVSRIANGSLAGSTLRELVADRAQELLGYPAEHFPLLIKLLDARENLSIQVHPDDTTAPRLAPLEGGKTEAWVVLEAEPTATIYLGLKPGFDRKALERELVTGNLPLCLNRFSPQPGDCYFVPAGTIHALGGGCVVLEVQQSSDATFRLYDWGRIGPDGQPRPLHLRAGLECLSEKALGAGLQMPRELDAGGRIELVRCPYFQLERWRGPATLSIPEGPHIMVAVGGLPQVATQGLLPGRLLFWPACVPPEKIDLACGDELVVIAIPPRS